MKTNVDKILSNLTDYIDALNKTGLNVSLSSFDSSYMPVMPKLLEYEAHRPQMCCYLKSIKATLRRCIFDKACLTNYLRRNPDAQTYYGCCYGKLEYRTVHFEEEIYDVPNYQGNAVVNYTEREIPYTRIIEHKHFEMFGQEVYNCPKTVISKEYSREWTEGMEPYYPVNDVRNNDLYQRYKELADKEEKVVFGGRLAEYKYYDMAPIIEKIFTIINRN